MDKEKIKKIVEIWMNSIELENINELEQEIGMQLSDLIIEMISQIYDEYSVVVDEISIDMDSYDKYVFSSNNGKYSLTNFLLNRLLRNIQSIKYKDFYFGSCSSYDHDSCEVIIERDRMKNKISDIDAKRKLVVHELMHGIKTQFYSSSSFNFKKYYEMKNKMTQYFPQEINDFSYDEKIEDYDQWNYAYNHCGLSYSSAIRKKDSYLSSFDITNVDEILNEVDALKYSNDKSKQVVKLQENIYMVLRNPESSNTFITNYGYILDQLINKVYRFIGLYLKPAVLFEKLNSLYSDEFQKSYNSNKTFIEIFSDEINELKNNPQDIQRHIKLLNTLYGCLDIKFINTEFNERYRKKNVHVFANNGLLRIENNRLVPLDEILYRKEFENNRIEKNNRTGSK